MVYYAIYRNETGHCMGVYAESGSSGGLPGWAMEAGYADLRTAWRELGPEINVIRVVRLVQGPDEQIAGLLARAVGGANATEAGGRALLVQLRAAHLVRQEDGQSVVYAPTDMSRDDMLKVMAIGQ